MDEKRPSNQSPEEERGVWRRVVSSMEGRVLLAGIALFVVYAVVIGLLRPRRPALAQSLVAMTFAHILGGRAAGMSSGYAGDVAHWIVVGANMVIETFLVLLFYPLFVFSYNRLIVIKPLEDTMARIRAGAEAHQRAIMKFGIPWLIVFVWFPFAMTGPVVGSAIGFLVGLRPWVNIAVVLFATYMAILSWSILFRRINEYLAGIGPYIPFVFVGAIVLVAISIHIRYAFIRHVDYDGAPPDED